MKIRKGFTLIELLVVIAIIAIIAGIVLVRIGNSSKESRDARRLSDMDQIQKALEMYKIENSIYPGNTDNDCGGWDVGYNGDDSDPFITPLVSGEFMPKVPGDPSIFASCGGYRYYRYSAGNAECDASRGAYYVLGVVDMETSDRPHPKSPGWRCPNRNWQTELDWVTGNFTN